MRLRDLLSRPRRPASRASSLRVADAVMQIEASGRLPADVASGGSVAGEPAPDYIAEAAEPSEAAWKREEERYRRRRHDDDGGSGGSDPS